MFVGKRETLDANEVKERGGGNRSVIPLAEAEAVLLMTEQMCEYPSSRPQTGEPESHCTPHTSALSAQETSETVGRGCTSFRSLVLQGCLDREGTRSNKRMLALSSQQLQMRSEELGI